MTQEQKIIRAEVGRSGCWNLAKQLGNVSQACKIMEFKELDEKGGRRAGGKRRFAPITRPESAKWVRRLQAFLGRKAGICACGASSG